MTKRTHNLVTVGIAVSLFLVGLGITTYLGAREEPAHFAETDGLESLSVDQVPSGMGEEDDGCVSIVGRGEWPEEMSQAVLDGSRPGHADAPTTADDAQGEGSLSTGPVQAESPGSPGTADGRTPPSSSVDQGGAAKDVTCPRGLDYSDSECPEL
jgi:hypothetical protein